MIHTRFEERAPHGDEGEVLRGDVYRPDDGEPESAVVVVHGFKGFKDWGFFPHLCRRLAEDGHGVVAFNFSRNGIGPDLETFSDLDAFGRNTYSNELADLRWVLDRVETGDLLPRPVDRVGCVAHSRGGGIAVVAAREDARIGALVTWSAVATLDRWDEAVRREWRENGRIHVLNGRTGQQMPLDLTLLEDFEANRDRFDVPAAAAEVRVPWLVVHGIDDAAVPFADARLLADAGPSAELRAVEGAGHTFEVGHPFRGTSPELERAVDATRAHLRRHLGAPAPSGGGRPLAG